jgi:four helix bundle protein
LQKFSFEKLIVWQKAREFTLDLYKSTQKFPGEEKFGLTSQIRRAAVQ